MRSATALARAARTGLQQQQQQAIAAVAIARGLSAPAHTPEATGPPTLLQQYVPQVINAVPQAFSLVTKTAASAYDSALTSGAAKAAVAYFADNVLLSETFLELKDIDLPGWALWLAAGGYTNQAAWAKITASLTPGVASLTPSQVAAVADAYTQAGVYDQPLFAGLAQQVQANFTEFDTAGLVKIAHAFATYDHYSVDLFDDIADGITYCNHYLSPMPLSQADLANAIAAFAKYDHDRADLFVALSRAINEDKLHELTSPVLASTVLTFLRSFDKFQFWPDATEGLFVVAEQASESFSEADKAEIEGYIAKVESYAGGHLAWFRGGHKDPEHFEGGSAFSNYNLWVLRDQLVPATYKPSDIRVWKQ